MNIEYNGLLNEKPMYIGTYKGYVEVGMTRMSVINALLFDTLAFKS